MGSNVSLGIGIGEADAIYEFVAGEELVRFRARLSHLGFLLRADLFDTLDGVGHICFCDPVDALVPIKSLGKLHRVSDENGNGLSLQRFSEAD